MSVSKMMEEVWRWKDEIAKEIEGMTSKERIAYFNQAEESSICAGSFRHNGSIKRADREHSKSSANGVTTVLPAFAFRRCDLLGSRCRQ